MSFSIARFVACMAFACLTLASHEVRAHYDDAYYYSQQDLPPQHGWMATLHDDTLLRHVSMPGTHGSAAQHGGWIVRNQTLTIEQQLRGGIRFLDLRARHYHNGLEMHHGFMYQHQDLSSVLGAIARFLQQNPTETVLIRLKEEHSAAGNTRSFEASVNAHLEKYARWFRADAHWNMRLRDLRGRIVLLKNFAGGYTPFGHLNFHWDLVRQDDHHLGSNWDLYWKWEKVKHLIHLADKSGPNPVPFINFLSGSGGALPYFVASGHGDASMHAGALSTGLVTPFFNGWYPDFPRGSCFIGMCTIFFEGTNTLTKHYLRNHGIRYAGIIAADFPGAGLIQSVIEVNRTSRMVASAANGKCLDIEGGVGQGRRLLTWGCHGGNNQRLTVRGDQILVGGLCLDVEYGQNAPGARVIAWPCHGRANQRWKVEDNGHIRSLMPGVQRCLDVNVGQGHGVGLWSCAANASDRIFRTRVH